MNRKETRLLVENWRKVLSGGLNDSKQELLEEGMKEFLASLALGASVLLNPTVGHTFNNDELEAGLELAFKKAGKPITATVTGPKTLKITSNDTGKSFNYSMPDTSGFEGSHYDNWFKTQVKSVSDWKSFLDQSMTIDGSGKNLFISGGSNNSFSGAQYRSDLTNTHAGLLSDLNALCEMSKSEIFELANGRLIVIGYTQDNMPITWVDFDENILERSVNKMKQDNAQNKKQGLARSQFNDLRRVVERIKAENNY